MPVLKGVMGYTRFLIKNPETLSADAIAKKLNMFIFKPLQAKGEDKETAGWCAFLSEYDSEKVIEVSDILFDRKVVLCMRIDTVLLPKSLLKAMVKKSLASYAKEHHKIPDKTIRKEIELAETISLRARILPKIKVIEAVWCNDSHELKIFTRSKAHLDRFLELFQQTFLLKAERKDFAFLAFQQANKMALLSTLENMAHAPIFIPPVRIDVQ